METTDSTSGTENNRTVDSTGDNNQINQGDIYNSGEYNVFNYFNQSENEIKATRVSVSTLKENDWPPLKVSDALFQQLKRNKILILFKKEGYNPKALMNDLALRLYEADANLPVLNVPMDKEKSRKKVFEKEFTNVGNREHGVLLLAEGIKPNDIMGGPSQITSWVERGQYLLAISSVPISTWKASPDEARSYFFEFPDVPEYKPEEFRKWSIRIFNKEARKIKFEEGFNAVEYFEKETTRAGGFFYGLNTPEKLKQFIYKLGTRTEHVTKFLFEKIANETKSDSQNYLKTWFVEADEKDRLLLLSAALFSGVFEKQYFELTSALIDRFWHFRNTTLKSFDVCDLETFSDFFYFEEYQGRGLILKTNVENTERTVIELGLKSYKRHIISSIEVISEAIRNSVGHGNYIAPVSLRENLSYSLSVLLELLDEYSSPVVKELCNTKNDTLRNSAARTLAWIFFSGNFDLFKTIMEKWKREADEDSNWRMKLTLAKALSYATQFETANNMKDSLVQWIKDFYNDDSVIVQNYMKDMLPSIILNHPVQMAPLIKDDLLKKKDQIEPAALGLAYALEAYTHSTWPIVKSWIEEGMKNRHETGTGARMSHRDRYFLAAVLATAYHNAYSNTAIEGVTGFHELLATVLRGETQTVVRYKLIGHLTSLLKEFRKYNGEFLRPVYSSLNTREKDYFIKELNPDIRYATAILPSEADPEKRPHILKLACKPVAEGGDLPLSWIEGLYPVLSAEEKLAFLQLWEDVTGREGFPADRGDLDLVVKYRAKEKDPLIKGALMGIYVKLIQMHEVIPVTQIIKMMENSVFEEKIELLKLMIEQVIAGKITETEKVHVITLSVHTEIVRPQAKKLRDELFPLLVQLSLNHHILTLRIIHDFSVKLPFRGLLETASVLGQIYLAQRCAMEGGDFNMEIQGKSVPVFLNARPLTAIEKSLYEWIELDDGIRKKIAILAFFEFSKILDKAEKREKATYRPPVEVQRPVFNESVREGFSTGISDNPISFSKIYVQAVLDNRVYPPDPPERLPVLISIAGWFLMLFSGIKNKSPYWFLLKVIFMTPAHGLDIVWHTIERWKTGPSEVAKKQGSFLERLFSITGKTRPPQ